MDPLARYSDAELLRIDSLLEALLDLPPNERSNWLARHQQSDPTIEDALRAAVLKLETMPDEAASDDVADSKLPIGTRLGPWQTTAAAIVSGSANVYRGERVDGQFAREVAIKVLRERSPDWQRRFARERAVLASLAHPHIASLIDAGTTSDGEPYIVMPWLDGVDFSQWCQRQLTPAEKLRRFASLVDAVAYAHQRSVIHRDLKPSNVRSDASGELTLLDFGISLLFDAPDSHATQSPLTPGYASPEQLEGGVATTLSDIHALGLLLFELLFGRPAYPEATRSLAHAVQSICGARLPAIDAHVLRRDWRPSQAHDLSAVLERCVQKQPGQRYASALELASDLRAVLNNLATQARPRTTAQRASSHIQRHPLRYFALVCAVLAAVFFAHVYVRQNQQIALERNDAIAQVKRLEALREHFSLILRDGGSGANSARAALDESISQLGRSYRDAPADHAQLLLSLGEIYLAAGDNQAVMSVLQKLTDSPELMHGLSETQTSQAFETLIFAGLRIAQPAQVKSWLQRWQRALPADTSRASHPRWAIAQAMFQRQGGDARAAFAAQLRAVEQLAKAPDATGLGIGVAMSNLGSSALQLGDLAAAEHYLRRAFGVWQAHGIAENDNVRTAQTNLGHVIALRGDPAAALEQYRPIERALRARGANTAPFAALLNGIARSEMQLGNFQQAAENAATASAILQTISGPNSLDVLGTLITSLEAAAYLQQPTDALIERITGIAQSLPPPHPLKTRAQLSVQRVRYLQASTAAPTLDALATLADTMAQGPPSLRPAAIRSYLDLADAAVADKTQAKRFVDQANALLDANAGEGSLDRIEVALWQQCLQGDGANISAIERARFEVIAANHPRRLALAWCL